MPRRHNGSTGLVFIRRNCGASPPRDGSGLGLAARAFAVVRTPRKACNGQGDRSPHFPGMSSKCSGRYRLPPPSGNASDGDKKATSRRVVCWPPSPHSRQHSGYYAPRLAFTGFSRDLTVKRALRLYQQHLYA